MSTGLDRQILRKLKVSSIFNEKAFRFFKEKGVYHFGFDFRPKSMNFIQEHVVVELVKNLQVGSVTLAFENEKDFVVKRILEEIEKRFSGEIILEFSGNTDFDFFDSFNKPYYFIDNDRDVPFKGRNQKGKIYPQGLLNDLLERGQENLLDPIGIPSIVLKVKRELELPTSITDFMEWDFIDLELTMDLCSSFHQLNEIAVDELLKRIQNFIKLRDMR